MDYMIRRIGTTTRLADAYIQILLTTGEVVVIDNPDTILSNKRLLSIITNRIRNEHSNLAMEIVANGKRPVIKLN